MPVDTAATGENDQHQPDSVTAAADDSSDDRSNEWSQRCSRGASDDGENAQGAPGARSARGEAAGVGHKKDQDHRAGDAELVAQSFPAGTTTPPLDVSRHDASPNLSLSFGSTQPVEPIATDSAAPRELMLDLLPEQEPESEPESGPDSEPEQEPEQEPESEPESEPEPEREPPEPVGRKSLKRKASEELTGHRRK